MAQKLEDGMAEKIDEELFWETRKKRDLQEIANTFDTKFEATRDWTWADYLDLFSVKLHQGLTCAYTYLLLGYGLAKRWAPYVKAFVVAVYVFITEWISILCA